MMNNQRLPHERSTTQNVHKSLQDVIEQIVRHKQSLAFDVDNDNTASMQAVRSIREEELDYVLELLREI